MQLFIKLFAPRDMHRALSGSQIDVDQIFVDLGEFGPVGLCARGLRLQPGRGFADLRLRLARGLRDRAVAKLDPVQPPGHLLQERRALRWREQRRELTQERELLVGEGKCVHGRGGSLFGCSSPRAIARSTACTNRASILTS